MISNTVILSLLTVSCCFTASSSSDVNELKSSAFELSEMIMTNVDKYCTVVRNRTEDDKERIKAQNRVRLSLLSIFHDECDDTPSEKNTTTPPTTPPMVHGSDPCTSISTVTLTGEWRRDNHGSNLRPINGLYACDRDLQGNTYWFRFSECAGGQLSNICAPAYSCGTHGGFWSNAAMPTYVGEVRQVPIYGSWNGNCYWYTWPSAYALTVKRCSSRPGDFVYKVYGTSSCNWAFCGMPVTDH